MHTFNKYHLGLLILRVGFSVSLLITELKILQRQGVIK